MGRRLVVSNIHGEGHRLREALRKAAYNPDRDRLFLLGDYIDRGTDSKATVALVRSLVSQGTVALKGNHEAMMIAAVKGDRNKFFTWQFDGGLKTWDDYGGWMPPDEEIAWLDSIPLYHEEPDVILVHAGLFPGRPLAEQTEKVLLWITEPFLTNYRDKHVIFGHTPTPYLHGEKRWEPWFGPDKTGIDTGAVYGGKLTVLDIDSRTWWSA